MNVVNPDNAQHIGCREQQEDSFGFSAFDHPKVIEKRGCLAVIADGMGECKLGNFASQQAVNAFLQIFQNLGNDEGIQSLLQASLFAANEVVLQLASEKGLEGQVGSTLIAATIKKGHLYWISVGDSRIYLFRNQNLVQLTEDHIYANILNQEAENEIISKEEAKNHPQKGALTSFLGLENLVEVDQNIKPFPLEPNDRVILCSDGLYGFLEEEEITRVLIENSEHASQALVDSVIARKHPFQDNVTVAILNYLPVSASDTHSVAVTSMDVIPTAKVSKSKGNKWLQWIITVFIVLLVVGGGFFGYKYVMKNDDFKNWIPSEWNPFKQKVENKER